MKLAFQFTVLVWWPVQNVDVRRSTARIRRNEMVPQVRAAFRQSNLENKTKFFIFLADFLCESNFEPNQQFDKVIARRTFITALRSLGGGRSFFITLGLLVSGFTHFRA